MENILNYLNHFYHDFDEYFFFIALTVWIYWGLYFGAKAVRRGWDKGKELETK